MALQRARVTFMYTGPPPEYLDAFGAGIDNACVPTTRRSRPIGPSSCRRGKATTAPSGRPLRVVDRRAAVTSTSGAGRSLKRRVQCIPFLPIGQLYVEVFRNYSAGIALVDGERRLSYADLADWVAHLIGGFDELGLRPGDALGLALNNGADYIAFTWPRRLQACRPSSSRRSSGRRARSSCPASLDRHDHRCAARLR